MTEDGREITVKPSKSRIKDSKKPQTQLATVPNIKQVIEFQNTHVWKKYLDQLQSPPMPERIYNPITAMGFSAMFTFQLDNTKR